MSLTHNRKRKDPVVLYPVGHHTLPQHSLNVPKTIPLRTPSGGHPSDSKSLQFTTEDDVVHLIQRLEKVTERPLTQDLYAQDV